VRCRSGQWRTRRGAVSHARRVFGIGEMRRAIAREELDPLILGQCLQADLNEAVAGGERLRFKFEQRF
jgi:hypothetical protein